MATVTNRRVWRETHLALVVLALAFLNFGHSSAVFAAGGRIVVTATSVCGDSGAAPAGDHFACHACRPDIAILPPTPCGVAPVAFSTLTVAYPAPLVTRFGMPPERSGNPRAPPAI